MLRSLHPDAAGSSPRVRGTRSSLAVVPRPCRFIPACAGNSSFAASRRHRTSVHPRVCGELVRGCVATHARFGSSPRVRGTPAIRLLVQAVGRFIPACAGNSCQHSASASSVSVHPRVCGELCTPASSAQGDTGSSPRVRGTRRTSSATRPDCRFIPACAGNSPCRGCRVPAATVHPRVCGELKRMASAAVIADGSSPRVRGTPPRPVCAAASAAVHPRVCGELGFGDVDDSLRGGSSPRVRGTPEGAGEVGRLGSVHPRVCGELWLSLHVWVLGDGSSPRVRGTPGRWRSALASGRFIPACAGNSMRRARRASLAPVHPRVCGELREVLAALDDHAGSSPRVRGTLERVP